MSELKKTVEVSITYRDNMPTDLDIDGFNATADVELQNMYITEDTSYAELVINITVDYITKQVVYQFSAYIECDNHSEEVTNLEVKLATTPRDVISIVDNRQLDIIEVTDDMIIEHTATQRFIGRLLYYMLEQSARIMIDY